PLSRASRTAPGTESAACATTVRSTRRAIRTSPSCSAGGSSSGSGLLLRGTTAASGGEDIYRLVPLGPASPVRRVLITSSVRVLSPRRGLARRVGHPLA